MAVVTPHLSEPPPPGKMVRRAAQRQRPQRSLPSDRLKMDVQKRLLRSIATLSGPGKRPVEAQDLAASTGLSAASAGLCNSFFAESGWLVRVSKGKYAATDALLEYSRRLSISPESIKDAVEPLQAPMCEAWHWQALAPMVKHGPIARRDSVLVLMREAGASDHPDHLQQLNNLLEWLEYVGLITLDEDRVRPTAISGTTAEVKPQQNGEGTQGDASPRPAENEPTDPPANPEVTKPSPPNTGQPGNVVLAFDFSFKMTADDLARLRPEQITALYQAMGTVAALTSGRH